MILGSYLIVITDHESVGTYLGHPIFKVLSLKVFPCDHSLRNSPEELVKKIPNFRLPVFHLYISICDRITILKFDRKGWNLNF